MLCVWKHLSLSLGQVEGSYDYKTIMTELHRGKQTRIHGFILPAQMRYWPLLNIFSYLFLSNSNLCTISSCMGMDEKEDNASHARLG